MVYHQEEASYISYSSSLIKRDDYYLLFSLALQPSAGYGLLVHEVS
jgi:hypothetical protein